MPVAALKAAPYIVRKSENIIGLDSYILNSLNLFEPYLDLKQSLYDFFDEA